MDAYHNKWINDLSLVKRSLLEQELTREAALHVNAVIPRRKMSAPIPVSFSQKRLWFLNQFAPDSSAYNVATALRLKGPLDEPVLRLALEAIVDRHASLRTTFIMENDTLSQQISEKQAVEVVIKDLRALPDSEAECRRFVRNESKHIFNLRQGPLLRCHLLKLKVDEHVLLVTNHHIISDGWSITIFLRELVAFYEAFLKRKPPSLAELPIQYADYAVWQLEWLENEQRQSAYWEKQLEGPLPILELPADRPRPAVKSDSGASVTLVLPQNLTNALKIVSRKENCTVFMTLLAAFQVLLQRYTGQKDICVGVPIAGRAKIETEMLIGPFINTLVMRTDLSGNPSFKELLGRVRQVAFDAYANQDYPFEKLVEKLRPERNLSYSPLFQVLFNFRNVPDKPAKMAETSLEPFAIEHTTAQFDLTLEIAETSDGFTAEFIYNTDLFKEKFINRMFSHLQTLLQGIAADPEVNINSIPLLTDPERHQLLLEWNDTQTDYPGDQCLHQVFEAQTVRAPDAIAIIHEDKQITYRKANEQANQLAHFLIKQGVGPEVLVGICMERSIEMIVGLLGILKAGGAYVPLDPTYPKARLAFMLEDTQAPILLTQKGLLEDVSMPDVKTVYLYNNWEQFSCYDVSNPSPQTNSDNVAHVIYTSGSTGTPKGVEVLHRGVLRLLFGVNYAQLNAEETLLQLAPISFDASTFEIWGALLHGARCVLYPERIPTPRKLGAIIQKHGIRTLHLVTPLFNTIMDEDPQVLSGIEQLLIGGEALSISHVRRALECLPAIQIINGYGPTENTTFTSCYPIPRQLDKNLTSIPIGRPIGNTLVYIVDPNLNPVPIGVPGELCTGGAGLARGYLHKRNLTDEKFIPNPFSPDSNDRIYKTGDLARYLPDGNIEYLGRMDHQVKIRGFRIELGEIEVALKRHASLREAVVILREDKPGDKRLVTYMMANAKSKPTTSELQLFLKETLPDYMIPSVFVWVATLPLTSSGKLDRRALPIPDYFGFEERKPYIAPRSTVEQTIAAIWHKLLGVDKVGIHDNFFELGGHSLLVTRLVSRLRDTFHVELPVRYIFDAPTVDALAKHIEKFIRQEEVDPERIDQVLKLAQNLSDEELKRLIDQLRENK